MQASHPVCGHAVRGHVVTVWLTSCPPLPTPGRGSQCPAVRGPGGPTVLSCLSLRSRPDLVALTAGAALLKNVSSRARPPSPMSLGSEWAAGLRRLLLYEGACFHCGCCLTKMLAGFFFEDCDIVNDMRRYGSFVQMNAPSICLRVFLFCPFSQ